MIQQLSSVRQPRKHLIRVYLLLALSAPVILVLSLIVVSQKPGKVPSSSTILLRDDFSTKTPGQTVVKDSTWENVSPLFNNNDNKTRSHWTYVVGKVYHDPQIPIDYSIDPKSFVSSVIVAGEKNWTNYLLEARAEPVDEGGFGLAFRYQDVNNLYRLILQPDNNSNQLVARIDRKFKGEVTTIASAKVSKEVAIYQIGQWYRLKVAISDNSFQVFVEGKNVLNAKDNSFSTGKIGLWSWVQSGVFFDDVLVTKLS